MCGVRPDGENHFKIAPRPGGDFAFADFAYQSVYVEVSVRWEKSGGKYRYTISIPANTTAEISLPGQEPVSVTKGEYFYEC